MSFDAKVEDENRSEVSKMSLGDISNTNKGSQLFILQSIL